MITKTIGSNRIFLIMTSVVMIKRGRGAFTIILRNLLSFVIITTITISIIRFFIEDGGMMMAVTIGLREKLRK